VTVSTEVTFVKSTVMAAVVLATKLTVKASLPAPPAMVGANAVDPWNMVTVSLLILVPPAVVATLAEVV
jgi:hypothetical protein